MITSAYMDQRALARRRLAAARFSNPDTLTSGRTFKSRREESLREQNQINSSNSALNENDQSCNVPETNNTSMKNNIYTDINSNLDDDSLVTDTKLENNSQIINQKIVDLTIDGDKTNDVCKEYFIQTNDIPNGISTPHSASNHKYTDNCHKSRITDLDVCSTVENSVLISNSNQLTFIKTHSEPEKYIKSQSPEIAAIPEKIPNLSERAITVSSKAVATLVKPDSIVDKTNLLSKKNSIIATKTKNKQKNITETIIEPLHNKNITIEKDKSKIQIPPKLISNTENIANDNNNGSINSSNISSTIITSKSNNNTFNKKLKGNTSLKPKKTYTLNKSIDECENFTNLNKESMPKKRGKVTNSLTKRNQMKVNYSKPLILSAEKINKYLPLNLNLNNTHETNFKNLKVDSEINQIKRDNNKEPISFIKNTLAISTGLVYRANIKQTKIIDKSRGKKVERKTFAKGNGNFVAMNLKKGGKVGTVSHHQKGNKYRTDFAKVLEKLKSIRSQQQMNSVNTITAELSRWNLINRAKNKFKSIDPVTLLKENAEERGEASPWISEGLVNFKNALNSTIRVITNSALTKKECPVDETNTSNLKNDNEIISTNEQNQSKSLSDMILSNSKILQDHDDVKTYSNNQETNNFNLIWHSILSKYTKEIRTELPKVNPLTLLKTLFDTVKYEFNLADFRPGQLHTILMLLSGKNVLCTLQVGAGKTLTYLLFSRIARQLYQSITIVVSPLLSLIQDQIRNTSICLRAAAVTSHQTRNEKQTILNSLEELDILLISPEMLTKSKFLSIIEQKININVGLFVIDESHCISEWSHSFRPSYLEVRKAVARLREKNSFPILALTGTPTPTTAFSICNRLDNSKSVVCGSIENINESWVTDLHDNISKMLEQNFNHSKILGLNGIPAPRWMVLTDTQLPLTPATENEEIYTNSCDKELDNNINELNLGYELSWRASNIAVPLRSLKKITSSVQTEWIIVSSEPFKSNFKSQDYINHIIRSDCIKKPVITDGGISANYFLQSQPDSVTNKTKTDIMEQETLKDNVEHNKIESLVGVEFMPNIEFIVIHTVGDRAKFNKLQNILSDPQYRKFPSIIVYVHSQLMCYRVTQELKLQGHDVLAYHAGLSNFERQVIFKAFMNNEIRILICTIAFGMGVDKPDIRAVIHYTMPDSIESYVQEVGRCARDGLGGICTLLLDNSDYYQKYNQIAQNILTDNEISGMIRSLFDHPLDTADRNGFIRKKKDLTEIKFADNITNDSRHYKTNFSLLMNIRCDNVSNLPIFGKKYSSLKLNKNFIRSIKYETEINSNFTKSIKYETEINSNFNKSIKYKSEIYSNFIKSIKYETEINSNFNKSIKYETEIHNEHKSNYSKLFELINSELSSHISLQSLKIKNPLLIDKKIGHTLHRNIGFSSKLNKICFDKQTQIGNFAEKEIDTDDWIETNCLYFTEIQVDTEMNQATYNVHFQPEAIIKDVNDVSSKVNGVLAVFSLEIDNQFNIQSNNLSEGNIDKETLPLRLQSARCSVDFNFPLKLKCRFYKKLPFNTPNSTLLWHILMNSELIKQTIDLFISHLGKQKDHDIDTIPAVQIYLQIIDDPCIKNGTIMEQFLKSLINLPEDLEDWSEKIKNHFFNNAINENNYLFSFINLLETISSFLAKISKYSKFQRGVQTINVLPLADFLRCKPDELVSLMNSYSALYDFSIENSSLGTIFSVTWDLERNNSYEPEDFSQLISYTRNDNLYYFGSHRHLYHIDEKSLRKDLEDLGNFWSRRIVYRMNTLNIETLDRLNQLRSLLRASETVDETKSIMLKSALGLYCSVNNEEHQRFKRLLQQLDKKYPLPALDWNDKRSLINLINQSIESLNMSGIVANCRNLSCLILGLSGPNLEYKKVFRMATWSSLSDVRYTEVYEVVRNYLSNNQ